MHIDSVQWRDVIISGAAEMGISISSDHVRQFGRHAKLLLEWNRKINLTAITDPEQMAVKHYLDSLAPLAYIPEDARCLDIGTGGGFPGIPIKIVRPLLRMTLIDSVRRKVSFIKEVIRNLALEHTDALHVRAQDLARRGRSGCGYEVVMARAVSELSILIDLARPLLAPQGRIIALKGSRTAPDLSASESDHPDFHADFHEYHLPVSGDQRTLIVITPNPAA